MRTGNQRRAERWQSIGWRFAATARVGGFWLRVRRARSTSRRLRMSLLRVCAGLGLIVPRAARVDANQTQIVSALRAAGASVQSLARIGNGCPDILAALGNQMYLMEIKHGKGKTNELQNRWHVAWNAPVHVVYSPDDALRVLGVIA